MNKKQAYALGYYYGRALGSYDYQDFDHMDDIQVYEFKQGYDSGVTDYCLELEHSECIV